MTDEPAKHGFALWNPKKLKATSSLGGKAAPAEKRTFSVNREAARVAGQKGGKSVPADKRGFALNREAARAAGKKGGMASLRKRREALKDVGRER
jgi:general stress protein YciG